MKTVNFLEIPAKQWMSIYEGITRINLNVKYVRDNQEILKTLRRIYIHLRNIINELEKNQQILVEH